MELFVRSGGRQSGKTYTIMQEIHNLILEGLRPTILLVFVTASQAAYWQAQWNLLFPHLPMPRYVTVENRLGARGFTFSNVYIENVNLLDEGIYDNRLMEIGTSVKPEGSITFTYSPTALSNRSHSRTVTKENLLVSMAQKRRFDWLRSKSV